MFEDSFEWIEKIAFYGLVGVIKKSIIGIEFCQMLPPTEMII